jgi:DNA-binding transcriptional LysR family regulator
MSDALLLFRTFVRSVEAGSFTAVAREFNSSQPTVSRQVALLEDHLGCLLFQRTTRALTLTDDGRTFYEHAQRTLEAVAEAESAVGRRKGKPSGVLRLACSGVFGRLQIIPRLPRFRARYPDVDISLHMGDGFVDLVEEGIDLAIRVGETTDGSLIARRIGTSRRVLVATPEYLERRGRPSHPSDLSQHECVVYDRLLTGATWTFAGSDGPLRIAVAGPVHVNNTEAVRACVLQGLGIGYVPDWHFAEGETESGRLVILLRDFEPAPQPIDAVYPSRRYLAPKVRAAIDYFAAEFDLDPGLRIADH